MTVNIHDAKTHFSRLLRDVAAGNKVIISKSGKPVAELIPVQSHSNRSPGSLKGQICISNDFDHPMEEFEEEFYK